MYRRSSKKKELMKRIAIYIAMTILVLTLATGFVLLILGYRFDSGNGRIEQGALLQFATVPPGATITIDGKEVSVKTPGKSTVLAGRHDFTLSREGYGTWRKTLDVKAGTLTWLNYARLVPTNRPVTSLTTYASLRATLASPDGRFILIQQNGALPSFDLVDVRADDIKTTTLTIPETVYSEPKTAGVTHDFVIDSWDKGSRYALVKHTYSDKEEWLVVDTRDSSASKNVTKLLDIAISSPVFSGTSGNILYAISSGDIRKLDLGAGTISRSLVTQVGSFSLFDTNVITYVGTAPTDPSKQVVGLYREGDTVSHMLRTVTTSATAPLHVATSRYFNQDYVAISQGSKVDIVRGSYPASGSDDTGSLSAFTSFEFPVPIDQLGFSPEGDYVLVQTGNQFASFDLEHQRFSLSSVTGDDLMASVAPLKWLDSDHVWSDYNGSLTMRDFDGTNTTTINQSAPGYHAFLSQNGRYFYSIGKTTTGYQLQRVRMILP